MALHRTVTIKSSSTADDNFRSPYWHARLRDAVTGDDLVSKETISRRHDQRIKDDLTNKLYRIELESVKPGYDVQLQTANFRNTIRPRSRHFSPEPGPRPRVHARSQDLRRYSTAGNLEIYRPKIAQSSFERPEPQFSVGGVDTSVTPWRAYVHDACRTDNLLNEYELRKQAELRVRGRSNGPLLVSSVPLVTTTVTRTRPSSTPPDAYHRVVERAASRADVPTNQNRGPRVKVNDSQYEIDQFEKLMNRTFGQGGVNRNKTLLYTAPPYPPYGHHEYTTLPPTGYYSTYAPLPTGAYYTPRHYYDGYHGGVYSPYYTGRPYYGNDYGNFYSSYVTLPASGSTNRYYYEERPRYASSSSVPALYSDLYQKPLEYGLYSPPTRVTGPGYYSGYYDTDWYGTTRAPYRYTY
jgi:hypothetical protein